MLMGRLSLLMTVVSRNLGEKYLKFYLEQQVDVQLVTLGRGTANDAMLDYFGLESHEKAVLFSVVDDQKWEELSVGLHRSMRIDVPGTGVAFLIPLASIGGRGIFTYLTRTLETGMPETGNTPANEETDRKRFREKRRTGKREADEAAAGQNGQYGAAEGSETMPESAYEMIIAVANQGYIEPIMEAARSAGAGDRHSRKRHRNGRNGEIFRCVACSGKRNDLHCDRTRTEAGYYACNHGKSRDGVEGTDIFIFRTGRRSSRAGYVIQIKF